MDQELINEINSVFAEVEQTHYMDTQGDLIHIYAIDAQVGDFITAVGEEYYVEHVIHGKNMLLLCHRVDSVEKIIVSLGREAIISVRRTQ